MEGKEGEGERYTKKLVREKEGKSNKREKKRERGVKLEIK